MASPLWPETLRRYDAAMFRLTRDHRWARRTLRGMKPQESKVGTLAVDKYLRLKLNPEEIALLTDSQLDAVLWHETQHILRHHEERLGAEKNRQLANIAADVEINGEMLAQGADLPSWTFRPESLGLEGTTRWTAEQTFRYLVENAPETQMPGDPSDSGEGDGDGDQQQQQGGKPKSSDQDEDDQDGDSGSNGDSQDQDDADEGTGGGGDTDDSGSDSEGEPDDGDSDGGEGQQPQPQYRGCGSASGGEAHPEEEPPPSPEEQQKQDRDLRRQDEEVIQEVQSHGFSDVSEQVYRAAMERHAPPTVDWRKELGALVRQAMEQLADEAEEYTFKRRSRRQAAFDDVILPGSYRPVPRLGVVADVSGSMDFNKLQAACDELYGIFDRAGIPEFTVFPFCTDAMVEGGVHVQTAEHIKAVFEDIGGGTDMLAGLRYALDHDCDVIVVLSDLDCRWTPWPYTDVPVVIAGIRPGGKEARLPKGVPYIEVKEVAS